jgi:hypothetical protein
MNDVAASWLRGVAFVTLFSPVVGAAVIIVYIAAADAVQAGWYPGGLLDVLGMFLMATVPAFLFAGPVALLASVLGMAVAVRWAKSSMPPQSLSFRLRLLSLTLGTACGLIVGFIATAPQHRWSDTLSVFLPAGIVVGLLLAILLPRVLGQPYRRLTSR